jgi:hypothetical protein
MYGLYIDDLKGTCPPMTDMMCVKYKKKFTVVLGLKSRVVTVNHLPAILSRMPLAEANLVNMLDFIYTEHDIYCNCIHQKNFELYKCK